MNLIELNRALRQLRLGGIATVLETRLRQAQAEAMTPIDFLSCLVSDELTRRGERLLERRKKQAEFRLASTGGGRIKQLSPRPLEEVNRGIYLWRYPSLDCRTRESANWGHWGQVSQLTAQRDGSHIKAFLAKVVSNVR